MALALKDGTVFLHIPKTGGNWVREVLAELDLVDTEIAYKHAAAERVSIQPYFDKYWEEKLAPTHITHSFDSYPVYRPPDMFAFVRNPISWYESWFKYQSDPERIWKHSGDRRGLIDWHVCKPINVVGDKIGKEGLKFNDFMRAVIKKCPGFVTCMYHSYMALGSIIYGRQEKLSTDLVQILQMLRIDFDPEFVLNYPKTNVSLEPENPIVWDKDVLEEVTRLEYAGIKGYGYGS